MGVSFALATEEEERAIQTRAAEIATYLDDVAATPRDAWRRFAELPDAARAIQKAENVLKTEPPAAAEELYKEYYKNGNRDSYQKVFFTLEGRIRDLAIAEALEDRGRFVNRLNVEIERFCNLKSWVLPAHDRNAKIYDGLTMYSDLGSTLAAADVAIAINLLGDKLDAKVVEKARNEVELRVLQPYERAIKQVYDGMWWIRTVNNWNAVCHAGTIVAALNVVESKERRAFFIAGAEYFSERYFMNGFSDDGYCSEGLGYWDYGFGNYILLGAAIRNATRGNVDMFRFPKIRAILDYAPNLEIDKGNYAVFADCSLSARPDALSVGYLSRLKNWGYSEFEDRSLGQSFKLGSLIETTTIGYDEEVVFQKKSEKAKRYVPPIRTVFKDAGVVICRPGANAKGRYFAVALKGGNNGELHNHNDVGSYSLLMGTNADPKAKDVYVSRDPGGENYTARTFSNRRYEGELLNSFGHPVPKIAGRLQSTGANRRGIVAFEQYDDSEDVVAFDISSAYPDVKTLEKAERRFVYRRAAGNDPGFFEITDSISFKDGAKETAETAIVTFEKDVEISETPTGGLRLKISGAVVEVEAKDADEASLKLVAEKTIVGENDDAVRNKPTRIALRVESPANSATIVQRFSVDE